MGGKPGTVTETVLAEVLAGVVRKEDIPLDSHFFDDLGANSLVMAHFCARVRKREDLPSVSMRDVYGYPTIRSLAAALADTPEPAAPVEAEAPPTGSTARYLLCGALQFIIFAMYCVLAGTVTGQGYEWVSSGAGVVQVYLRSAIFGGAVFVGVCTVPVVAKWILVGRWKETEFPVWGLAYVRFWTVKALLHANPMILFAGNPLYVLYLRALGARIGKGVTILSHSVPVCTDLLTIGDGTVIRKDTFFLCYQARAGRIRTGRVTLGSEVYVGEKTVLDIGTVMGDGSQLGHSSALYDDAQVPAGQRVHGSPAQLTDVDYVRVPHADCSALRRFGYGLGAFLQMLLVYVPLAIGGTYMLLTVVPALDHLLDPNTKDLNSARFYGEALGLSLVAFVGFIVLGFAAVSLLPRLLRPLLRPDKV